MNALSSAWLAIGRMRQALTGATVRESMITTVPDIMEGEHFPCSPAELEALDLRARERLLAEGWILCDEGDGDWSTIPPALQEWEGSKRVPATPMPTGAVRYFK